MEEFKSEDFSVSKEDEDYALSGGECHEDAVNELVKEGEMAAEEDSQKTKGTKRKAENVLARKRKHSGLSPQHEDEEDASRESGGSISEKEDAAAEQEKGAESEGAREEEEEEMLASSVSDVEPKSEVPPCIQVKTGEENEEMASSKVVKAEEQEKPKEPEEAKVTKVFDIAGEKVRFLRRQGRPGMSPEHEPPRSEGGQHAAEEEQRSVTNTSSKNESTKRKWKRRSNVVVTGEESKLRCCKEEYCIGTWNVRSMNPGGLMKWVRPLKKQNLYSSKLKRANLRLMSLQMCHQFLVDQGFLRKWVKHLKKGNQSSSKMRRKNLSPMSLQRCHHFLLGQGCLRKWAKLLKKGSPSSSKMRKKNLSAVSLRQCHHFLLGQGLKTVTFRRTRIAAIKYLTLSLTPELRRLLRVLGAQGDQTS